MAQPIVDEARIDRDNGVYGRVVARDVSAEDYMAHHAAYYREWVEGTVIDVAPVAMVHERLTRYLNHLFDTYFELNPIGTVFSAPFVMQLDTTHSRREPDIQVVLNRNPGERSDTAMIGPADICIEVVSPESAKRDYGDKFTEYEAAGIKEYWIIDPSRSGAQFYRLNDAGAYIQRLPDVDGHYRSPLLPQFVFHVPTLSTDPLPGPLAIARAVEAMLKKPSA